jgi:hypothetical protein
VGLQDGYETSFVEDSIKGRKLSGDIIVSRRLRDLAAGQRGRTLDEIVASQGPEHIQLWC